MYLSKETAKEMLLLEFAYAERRIREEKRREREVKAAEDMAKSLQALRN